MSERSDAIVIGAGPAGSFTALKLAELGLSVSVFEEHNEIGTPSHCPGHLSIRGLENLGLYPLPTHIIENTFSAANFYSPRGNVLTVQFSSPITCTVNRALFDRHIAMKAETSGAKYYTGSHVQSTIAEEGFVTGVLVRRNGKIEEKRAHVIIDAEGVSSRILRQTGLQGLDTQRLVNGLTAEAENVKHVDPDTVEVYFGKNYAPGFYAWLIPKKDGEAKIGLATKTGNPKDLLQKLITKHPIAKTKLNKAKVTHTTFHPLTLGGPITKAFSNGFLAVGDAASQVKPTTGGGAIFGMTCAKIAAETAHQALQNKDVSAKTLAAYQTRCQKALGFDANVMLRMRKTLDSMSDAQLDKLVDLCSKLGLDKVLSHVEDIDFQGKTILRTLRKPRMLPALAYFIYVYVSKNL